MAGKTASPNNIATTGSYPEPYFLYNGFIAKFDTDGVRQWGIYYTAIPRVLKVDSDSNVYFAGSASSSENNVTTPNSHQPTSMGGYDNAYLVKLNSNGIREWGTFYGGLMTSGKALCLDNQDHVYLAGATDGNNLISTPGVHQEQHASGNMDSDGFLAKFTPQGILEWGTYYGGTGNDAVKACVFAQDNHIYLLGDTSSSGAIATSGSYLDTAPAGYSTGFIAKITLQGQRIWGTYFGEGQYTNITDAGIKDSSLYFAGITTDSGLLSANTFNPTFQDIFMDFGKSAYIAKFDVQQQEQVWGTYFKAYIQSLAVNQNQEVFISGSTDEDDGIATPGSFREQNQYGEAYLIKLNTNGQRVWGTYYGGEQMEDHYVEGNYCNHVTVDAENNIYLSGDTWGSTTGIATEGAHQTTPGNSYRDAFLVKFQNCQTNVAAGSNSPVCPGRNLELTASGGTSYLWSGPNGFTSNLQNPVLTNANAQHGGLYTCLISGTGNCDGAISINVTVVDNTAPIPDVAILPEISGSCSTINIVFPTATDTCDGIINATTISPLTFTSTGTYTIVWQYTDQSNNTVTQEQTINVTGPAIPTVAPQVSFCKGIAITLANIIISGQAIRWYDASGIEVDDSTIPENGATYYATQTIAGCESIKAPVQITIEDTPPPTGTSSQQFCLAQSAVLSDLLIAGNAIIFYDAPQLGNVLASDTPVADGVTYWATQTLNGCESTLRSGVSVTLVDDVPASDFQVILCDAQDDQSENVNLEEYESKLVTNAAAYTYMYYTDPLFAEQGDPANAITNTAAFTISSANSLVYVRVSLSGKCHKVVKLSFILKSPPEANLKQTYIICPGSSVRIFAESGYSYTWSTGATTPYIDVSQPGSYWLVLTKGYDDVMCSSTSNFTVELSGKAQVAAIEISDWTDNENTITVHADGTGTYEYSLDGINYQSSNTFSGLNPGRYTVYVKDKNGCGTISEEIFLLTYPKFFTPNGDGQNDSWHIKFSASEPNMAIQIYDRYGKFIRSLSPMDSGWDGTLNGHPLPATDYWFVVKRDSGIQYRGHFSLIR